MMPWKSFLVIAAVTCVTVAVVWRLPATNAIRKVVYPLTTPANVPEAITGSSVFSMA